MKKLLLAVAVCAATLSAPMAQAAWYDGKCIPCWDHNWVGSNDSELIQAFADWLVDRGWYW